MLALEVTALWLLAALPLKQWVRKRLWTEHAASAFRWGWALLWYVPVFGLLLLLSPPIFFFMSGRPIAVSALDWLRDGLAMLGAIAPQLVAVAPYVWAARRAHRRTQR